MGLMSGGGSRGGGGGGGGGSATALKTGEPQPGSIYRGRVSNVMDFGCFVELTEFSQKFEGLVHVSMLSAQSKVNARDQVEKDQTVWVKVGLLTASLLAHGAQLYPRPPPTGCHSVLIVHRLPPQSWGCTHLSVFVQTSHFQSTCTGVPILAGVALALPVFARARSVPVRPHLEKQSSIASVLSAHANRVPVCPHLTSHLTHPALAQGDHEVVHAHGSQHA